MQNFNNLVTASGIQMDYAGMSNVSNFIERLNDVADILKELEEALLKPVRVIHGWIKDDTFDLELETVQIMRSKPGELAIVFKPDCVVVCGKKIYPKMNSVHVLVIRALIETQDEFGICTERQIENLLRDQGLPPREGEKMKDRIRLGIRAAKRFLNLEDSQIGQNGVFAKRIRNRGYLVDNTVRT